MQLSTGLPWFQISIMEETVEEPRKKRGPKPGDDCRRRYQYKFPENDMVKVRSVFTILFFKLMLK